MSRSLPFVAVIPARFASTRLPGKALIDIAGKPMVVRVAEQAQQSGASEVWIATDHADILAAAQRYNIQACLTRADHASGTDRIAEVASRQNWPDDTIVVNVQGDEPLIEPQLIREVANQLYRHPDAAIATACHAIHDAVLAFNPNIVKVVTDAQGYALYFSRAAIPYARDAYARDQTALPEGLPVLRHIGIYAYRAGFLKDYAGLAPATIEQFEALEQLRALWHGYKISVAITDHAPAAGVDTAEDLEQVRKLFQSTLKTG